MSPYGSNLAKKIGVLYSTFWGPIGRKMSSYGSNLAKKRCPKGVLLDTS